MKFNGHILAEEYSIQAYYTIHHRAGHEEQVTQRQKNHKN